MKEKVTLLAIDEDGTVIMLLDGRRLRVNPGDIPTACVWLPTAALEISDNKSDSIFPVTVWNTETDQKIDAMWMEV